MTGKGEKCHQLRSITTPTPGLDFTLPQEKICIVGSAILGSPSSTTPRPQWGGATRAGTKHSPSQGWAELVFGFGTGFGGGVQSLGSGTGTVLQWGQLHYVQNPTPFPGEVPTEGPGHVLTPLPCPLFCGRNCLGRDRVLLRACARDKLALAALRL